MKDRNYLRAIFSLILMSSMLSATHAEEPRQLTVFVDNSYPPYMYELEALEADGLYPRLIEEAAKRTSYQLEIKAYPWKRALALGAAGTGAVGGAYRNDERLKIYDYSVPLYEENLVLFVNKDRPFEFGNVEDLGGKLVGVNRGWSYGQQFDEARNRELFTVSIKNSPEENFQLLALGRIDCVILDKLSGNSYVELLNIKDKIDVLPNPFSINNGYLIVPKQLSMQTFLDEFNASVEGLRREGMYQEIVDSFVRSKSMQ